MYWTQMLIQSLQMLRGRFGSVLFLVKKVLDIFDEYMASGPKSISHSSQVLLEAFETQLRRLEAQAVGVRSIDFPIISFW